MNQNRNQNRRRGRGGNRGQGGGNQGNRIDSRARGNAPQLLEKYKKLAHDASLNGDRVQTEYYLQFADHYFRVVADSRAQREDQRPRREHDRDDRDTDREQSFDEADPDDERDEADNARRPSSRRRDRDDDEKSADDEGKRGVEGDEAEADAGDNPFVRDARGRRSRSRGRAAPANDEARNGEARDDDGAGFDAGILPPSIAREDTQSRPARTRGRRARPADDGDQETLEEAS